MQYESYHCSDDFIRRYIFPGGHSSTKVHLLDSFQYGSSYALLLHLVSEFIEDIDFTESWQKPSGMAI